MTYGDLLREVSKVAGVLQILGIKKGDTVAVYLPMNANHYAMLAIARLGLPIQLFLLGSQLVPLKTESTMLVVKLLSLVMKVKRW